jgi:hypothetical protein
MKSRHAIVLAGLMMSFSAASAQDFRIQDVSSAQGFNVAQLKPGVIAFSDQQSGTTGGEANNLIRFEDWTRDHPVQKRFLSLFPGYTEPVMMKSAGVDAKTNAKPDAKADAKPDAATDANPESKTESGPAIEKLYIYVAQARFLVDRAPAAIDLSRYVTLPFLERIDPAIKHSALAAADINPLKDQRGVGNENPQRKWCTGRPTLICIHSSYALEGRIPLGIMLVNKLRDSAKKVSDHIDFESELSMLPAADIDQAALKELTALDAPVTGVLAQNIFYVNQIMKFGKFFGVFQDDRADPSKTVVTAYMALAIKANVLDERRNFERVPVLRNLVPAQVLMGKSSFNSGNSISAGLPQYARNEIKMIAGILEHDQPAN